MIDPPIAVSNTIEFQKLELPPRQRSHGHLELSTSLWQSPCFRSAFTQQFAHFTGRPSLSVSPNHQVLPLPVGRMGTSLASTASSNNRSRQEPDGDRSRDRGTARRAFARRWRACCRTSQNLSEAHLARRDFSTVPPLSIWSAAGSSFTCFASSRQVSRST